MKLQILMSPGCGHGRQTVALMSQVVRELALPDELETIEVTTIEEAERLGFPGSPTVRVNGVDIEPQAPTRVGLG
ncbi:MAG: thioredoxin family protein [Anaeromyxobacteraceae bacterium]